MSPAAVEADRARLLNCIGASLAAAGMTGPEDIFEGKFGFWKQLFGRVYSLPLPVKFQDHVFAVRQTMIKSFPIRFNCHVPVFAALELRPKVREAEIETLVIETFKQAFERWISLPEIWRPETRETADHSAATYRFIVKIGSKMSIDGRRGRIPIYM